MDPVKSWMDVEKIRQMAAELLKEPTDLDALESGKEGEPVSEEKMEAKQRALKAISEASRRLQKVSAEKKAKSSAIEISSEAEPELTADTPESQPAAPKLKPVSSVPATAPAISKKSDVVKSTSSPESGESKQADANAKKEFQQADGPAVSGMRPVEELLKPTGNTAPIDLRSPIVSKTKLLTKTELTKVIADAKQPQENFNVSDDFDFQGFADILKKNSEISSLFIIDRDDDLYYDSIQNEKFLEVSKSMLGPDRMRMPETLYLRLGQRKFLQLIRVDGDRGLFVVGVIVDSLLEKEEMTRLRKEFLKLTDG